MTESQKQFEEWFFSEIDGGTGTEELCWQAWQASRAAVVVKLPDWFFTSGSRLSMDRDDVIKALDAVGVRYE